MDLTAHRRFTLIDAMVLVAATTVSLAALRCCFGDLSEVAAECREWIAAVLEHPPGWRAWTWFVCSLDELTVRLLAPFCWAWTVALLVVYLRQPRPRMRRLARQPGAVASFSAALILIPAAIGLLYVALARRIEFDSQQWERVLGGSFIIIPMAEGLVALGSWATLLFSRRWRAEASWIDRSGRALGFYWISAIGQALWVVIQTW
jgi:hypothetical protein